MLNKKYCIILQPLLNGNKIKNNLGETCKSPKILSINNKDGYEIMDHIFYVDSVDELLNYELIYDFVNIIVEMGKDFFMYESVYDIDGFCVLFTRIENESVDFLINISVGKDGNAFEIEENINDKCSCGNKCLNCNECEEDSFVSNYYFGIN